MAEDIYETLQTQQKQGQCAGYALMVMVVLLLGLSGFTGYYIATHSSTNTIEQECTTAACIELANRVLASRNSSVDPCHDFYHYACDGWIHDNRWRLTDDLQYSQFADIEERLKQNFLDVMFWSKHEQLTTIAPVQKAKIFFDSCLSSRTDRDALQSTHLLQEFIQTVNFSNADQGWDNNAVVDGFQRALAWLSQREWNSLFALSVYYKNDIFIQQNSDFWTSFRANETSFCAVVNETFLPLFMDLFAVNESRAMSMNDQVCAFAQTLNAIGVYPLDYLDSSLKYATYFDSAEFDAFEALMSSSSPLNLSRILHLTFNSHNVSDVYYFGAPDVYFLTNLSRVIAATDPSTVQLYLFANVLWYFLDYESSWTQSQSIARSEFCYAWTVDQFPFVFAYLTANTMFDNQTFDAVYGMASYVRDSMLDLIANAEWLHATSRTNMVDKAAKMTILTGYPQSIYDANAIVAHYATVPSMDNTTTTQGAWLLNVEKMNDWYVQQNIARFENSAFPILDEWPIIFAQKSAYRYWLTGVNAFYYNGPSVDGANFFVIPVTITQTPLFDIGYPLAAIYGAIGVISAHEMSHGFDPIGFGFASNGTIVNSIVSDDDFDYYDDATQCFVEQYDSIPMQQNAQQMNNGTRTQIENVADNVGLIAAYNAWRQHLRAAGSIGILPGVDMSDDKLFFWSFAYTWCGVEQQELFNNYTEDFSPHYTRVIGALQNSQAFKNAFGCDAEKDWMSNQDQCSVW